MKKILIIILTILVLMPTSCSKKEINTTTGEIDSIKYEETTEKTNYAKITMKDSSVIIIELDPEAAPKTVANFQKLISEKFYDNLTFHRISKGFVIQGGDPKGDGTGGSEETIEGEFRRNGYDNPLKHERGVISMARSNDMNSASSQFFICLSNTTASQLDDNYAAFGKVIAGMENVDKIAAVEVDGETPINKPIIHTIRFVTIEKIN